MKNIIVFLFSFFVFNSFSQTYELYSDVWERSKDDEHLILPKGGGSFSFPSDDMLKQIDTNKINSYMLESFNKFRKDYGKSSAKENKELTLKTKSYAKCLVNEFKHDPTLDHYKYSEVIATLHFIMLSKVDFNNIDINKVIADCCFDTFAGSYGHMAILLDENAKSFGFGIYKKGNSIKICIRGYYN